MGMVVVVLCVVLVGGFRVLGVGIDGWEEGGRRRRQWKEGR